MPASKLSHVDLATLAAIRYARGVLAGELCVFPLEPSEIPVSKVPVTGYEFDTTILRFLLLLSLASASSENRDDSSLSDSDSELAAEDEELESTAARVGFFLVFD